VNAIVIDDSSAMRMILRRTLGGLGFQVLEAVNGRDALDKLDALDDVPDVALVDWNMPVMDGLTFVRELRGRREYDSVQVLMVTTESDAHHVTSALEAGANEYVMKPFDRSALVSKLEAVGLPSAAAAG